MKSDRKSDVSNSERTAAQAFCANISLGMHEVAQPLTILRASLSLSRIHKMGVKELRELLASSANEVERVCSHLNSLQQFIETESNEPELAVWSLSGLVGYAREGVDRLFQESGISLIVRIPEQCESVLVNRDRTIHILSSILLMAHTVSEGGDLVQVTASCSSDCVQVAIGNANSSSNGLSQVALRGVALAEANCRSQHGRLQLKQSPFSAIIEVQHAVPKAERALVEPSTSGSDRCVQKAGG